MLSILCFGDSNTWGFVPGSANSETGLPERHDKKKRWTGVLQKTLGEDYSIIEEGLNGRTTTLDETTIGGRPFRNGYEFLPICLESHAPLDIVIFMLGTNDTRAEYDRSVDQIQEGMRDLIKIVKTSDAGVAGEVPQILLISPAPFLENSNRKEPVNKNTIEKSKKLAEKYRALAQEEECEFLDAALFVTSSQIDGIHLDETQHQLLGRAVAQKIKSLKEE